MAARSKKSSAAAAAPHRRRREWPWSELPPTTPFTVPIPPSLKAQRWLTRPPAITKSQLPTTTRCNKSHQRPLILHVITEKSSNPTAGNGRGRPSQFLGDSGFDIPAMCDLGAESYWCVLRVDSTSVISGPDPPPPYRHNRSDFPGPDWMTCTDFTGPNVPSSGLVVNHAISGKTGPCSYFTKHISIRHECKTIDPFDSRKKPIEFTTSIIKSQGKFFAMSLQGTLVVMHMIGTRFKITGVSAVRAIPSSNWRFFKEHLTEMNGEILLVFFVYEKSLAVVDRVEIFRLDLVKLGWNRVERLGGKTLFLKKKFVWADSAELGCRDDCVYFAEGDDEKWRVFDLKSGCFSTVLFGM